MSFCRPTTAYYSSEPSADWTQWTELQNKAILKELRATIIHMCGEISEALCRNVIANINVRLQDVNRKSGGHTEHVLKGDNSFQGLTKQDQIHTLL